MWYYVGLLSVRVSQYLPLFPKGKNVTFDFVALLHHCDILYFMKE